MNNNDILRRLRFAFNLSDGQATSLFSLDPVSAIKISKSDFVARLAKEGEDNFMPCSDYELSAFLDGLIVLKRGLKDGNSAVAPKRDNDFRMSKNDILKKLRIAMSFQEQQMLSTLERGGTTLSKSELSAFFRKPTHKHYRTCGNQVLRNFIKGLTLQLRDDT